MPQHRILIVEDEEGIALHILYILKKLGYIPLGPVARGDEAVLQAEALRPDLVLMDVYLQDGLTGIDAASQILGRFDIPVIYLTAVADEAVLQAARDSNPYAYMIKPVQQRELHAAIDLAIDKHEMEARLRRSEARYRRLFDTMTSGFMLLDVITGDHQQAVDYCVVDVNQVFLQMVNSPRENLIGRRMTEMMTNYDLSLYLKLYDETVQTGTSAQLEYYHAPFQRYLEIRAYSPDPGQLALIVNDVSERHRAEQAIAETELRFRQVAETVSEAFWLRSRADDKILYVNSSYERIWGHSAEELYADPQSFLNSVIPDDLPRVVKAQQDLKQNEVPFNEEYRILRPDGDQRWVWVRTFPVYEVDGQVVRYSGIAEDITERKRAEQDLMYSYRRTEQALRRMTVLRNIDMAITTYTDMQTMIGTVLDHIVNLNEVDAALMFYPDRTSSSPGSLRLAGVTGLAHESLSALVVNAMRREAERVLLTRQVSASPNLSNANRAVMAPGLNRSFTEQLNFRGYSFLPLLTKGQVKGVLLLLTRDCCEDHDHDLPEFFQSLAIQAAIAIDNVELFQGLKQSNSELRLAYDETIKGWAQALELRSADTRGHCERVVQLSDVLARALGMDEEHLVHFRRGVMLHDIGKLGIPDRILLKQGSLTSDEWSAIHMHPVYGYEMLRDIAYLSPAVNVVYCHHEHWDGSGYPRGLAGTAIPREARIFAVVDAWDALVNERPYHPPWPPNDAVEYLISQSGKQFDPEVVDAFLRLV